MDFLVGIPVSNSFQANKPVGEVDDDPDGVLVSIEPENFLAAIL